MEVLSLIRRKKAQLVAVEVVAVILFVLELGLLRYLGGGEVSGPVLALGVLPPLVATFAFLALWYLNWFGEMRQSWSRHPAQAFFWLVAISATVFWVSFYWFFVLQPVVVAA